MIRESTQDLREHVKKTMQSVQERSEFKEVRGHVDRGHMDKQLKGFIFGYFYYMISDKGRLLPHLFTGTQQEKFPCSVEEATDVNLARPWFVIDDRASRTQHSHKGRNCGRKFKVGEPIYRCKECSFDDTCVLCVHCFNPKDHEGHHVYTSICTEFNNGICDCGDAEAWNNPIHCKAEEHNGLEDDGFSDDDVIFSESLEVVLEELFNHFIDVFNQNIEPLPTFQKSLTMRLREFIQNGRYAQQADLLKRLEYTNQYIEAKKEYKGETSPNLDPMNDLKDYTVLIYNDEFHNYSQASAALRQGGPDNKHIDLLTAKIDTEGRSVLRCSHDVSSLMGGFFSVQTHGLSCTLNSWVDYLHQELCKYSIMWINDCLTIPNSTFQTLFRNALGQVLCSKYDSGLASVDMTSVVRDYFAEESPEENPYFFADNSILGEGNVIPLGRHKSLNPEDMNIISPVLNKVVERRDYNYSNSRLQYILFFENRYWKKLRKLVQDLIIPTLSSSSIHKPIFGDQLVEIFPHMTRSVAYMDREPQLTSLRESVVQLFTCPTTANRIFRNGKFADVIWPVIDVFADFSNMDNGTLVWQRVQRSNPSKSYSISFKQGLYAVETLLSKITDPNLLLRSQEFIMIATLCKLFNGAWKIRRKEGEHVLREDQQFIPYVEYTTSIYSIIQTFDKVLEQSKDSIDPDLLTNAIRLLDSFLSHRNLTYKLCNDFDIIKFKISKQRVSFMNPVHTLFSFLIEHIPLKLCKSILSTSRDFLIISDFALRSVVLCSQIDVGFWVRNGMSVLHQSSYYKNNPEMCSYVRDIHLNQLAFLMEKDNLQRVVYNMLDRWELLDWFNGTEEFGRTFYEEKISSIMQQFIAFVYQILTERGFYKKFNSLEEKQHYDIKNAIIYKLYTEPLSYTSLLNEIPDYLTESISQFDAALEEVSLYVEPKGLEDSGVFKLRKDLYEKVDPLRLLNMGNDFEHSASLIKAQIAGVNEKKQNIVLHPRFLGLKHLDEGVAQLGDFTRTDIFAKLVYKLLKVVVNEPSTSFAFELLHLIYGVFKDDEMINGKHSIPEAYIRKPICDLLLNIVESEGGKYSENVVSTADFLLENMIMKRPSIVLESLTECFGSEYVENFKAKKSRQGVDFEETELERKKRLARERQKQIMARFSKQQKKFMDKNDEYAAAHDEDVVMDNDGLTTNFTSDFDCSLCHDDKSDDFFVTPVYQSGSPIFLNGHMDLKEVLKPWAGFENNEHCSTENHEHFYKEKQTESAQNLINATRNVVVSCNHSIHYQCFKRYIDKKRFTTDLFICPLCQTYSNSVIPMEAIKFNSGSKIIHDLIYEGSESLLLQNLPESATEYSESMKKTLCTLATPPLASRRHSTVPNWAKSSILTWTISLCNNISMLEITSRLDKDTSSSLLTGKEQKFRTLNNILRAIAIYSRVNPLNVNDIEEFNKDLPSLETPNQLFFYVLQMSLYSSIPLCESLMHALALYVKTLVRRYAEIHGDKKHADFVNFKFISDSTPYHDMLLECLKQAGISSYSDNFMLDACYTMLVSEILPMLRKSMVMIKVFNEFFTGDQNVIINGIDFEASTASTSNELFFHKTLFLLTKYDLNVLLQRSLSDTPDSPLLKSIPIEYCNIVTLTNLATHLNTYVTNTSHIALYEEDNRRNKNLNNRLDYKICLICGVKIHSRTDGLEMSKHMTRCSHGSSGLFLIPNVSQVCLFLEKPNCTVNIAAPYLNSHGESGKNAIERGDLTVLNLPRYEHLNKLWLSNGIPGYISRVMGDEFRVAMANNRTFARNMFWRPAAAFAAAGDASDEEDLLNEEEDDDDDEELLNDEDDPNVLRFRDPTMEWRVNPDIARDPLFRLPTGRGDIHDFFEFVANLRGTGDDTQTGMGAADEILRRIQGGITNGLFNTTPQNTDETTPIDEMATEGTLAENQTPGNGANTPAEENTDNDGELTTIADHNASEQQAQEDEDNEEAEDFMDAVDW